MKKVKLAAFLFLIPFLSSQAFSQTLEDLQTAYKSYQSCLDQGQNMINCSRLYSTELDDLLTKTYTSLYENMDDANRGTLETDQQEWLAKKDVYFKKVKKEYATDISIDSRMIAIDKIAIFVRERIEELLYRLGSS